MTRRLILMRHAKSDWEQGLPDHARPLNKRGRRDAPRIADALASRGWHPDLVLCSDAQRTRETWERMAGAFEVAPRLVHSRTLYLAGLGELQTLVAAEAQPDTTTILALGHNPGWEQAASAFAYQNIAMTTANAVLLELPERPWEEAVACRAEVVEAVIRPKEL